MKALILLSFIMFFVFSVQGADVIVKQSGTAVGYKDVISGLSLYLYEAGAEPAGTVYTEPDYAAYVQGTDPLIESQTYLYKLKLENISSPSVSIAIIDTGVDFTHEDISGSGDNDTNGHGTAVAGIICAAIGNGIGIRGLVPADLRSYQVFDASGKGSYFAIAKALVEAADSGSKIIFVGGGGEFFSQALNEALEYAVAKGSFVVAPGGNTASETVLYPALYSSVASAGSLNNEGLPCTSADWGTAADGTPLGSCYGDNVDFMLPGTNIFTAKKGGGYGYFQGTSYSAAILAGIAGYVYGQNPALTREQALAKIKEVIDYGPLGTVSYTVPSEEETYSSAVVAVSEPASTYLAGVLPAPEGLVTVNRTFTKETILPTDSTKATLSIQNTGTFPIESFNFTENVPYKMILDATVEVKISSVSKIMMLNETASFTVGSSTYEVSFTKGVLAGGNIPYKFKFSSLPNSGNVQIKYNVSCATPGMYHFSEYLWTGIYDSLEYEDKELGGNFVIVEMPDVSGTMIPEGYYTGKAPVFSWPSAGTDFTYSIEVYKLISGRLSKIYATTEIQTNSFDWALSGKELLTGKTHLWKIKAYYNGKILTYSTIKFIPYDYDAPYPKSPEGTYAMNELPKFEWTAVPAADHYKIRVFKGRVKLFEYATTGNVTTVDWTDMAFDKNGIAIPVSLGAAYKWDVTAVSADSDLVCSRKMTTLFTMLLLNEPALLEPIGVIDTPTSRIFDFKWQSVTDATSYEFKIYSLSRTGAKKLLKKINNDVLPWSDGTSVQYYIRPLTKYMWTVTPKIGTSLGVTAVGIFDTTPGDPPEFILPESSTSLAKPVFQWTSGYDNVRLKAMLGTKKIFETVVTGGATSFDMASITPEVSLITGKLYKFYIRGEVGDDSSLYTKWRIIKVKTSPFPSPEITNADTFTTSLTPTITWTALTGAPKYRILIKKGLITILNKYDVSTNSYTYNPADAGGKNLVFGGVYTIQVAGVTTEGAEGLLSAKFKLTILPVEAPSIISPDPISGLNPSFSWSSVIGADAYEWLLYKGTVKLTGPNATVSNGYDFLAGTISVTFKNNGLYVLKVRAKKTIDGKVYYSKTAALKFKTYEMDAPTVVSPGISGVPVQYDRIFTDTPLLNWTAVSGVDYYELLVFDYTVRRSKIYKVYDNSYQIPELQRLRDRGKYYYTVRARSHTGFSNWADKAYFEVALMDVPVLQYPENKIYVTKPTFIFTVPAETTVAKVYTYKVDANGKRRRFKVFAVPRNIGDTDIKYLCPVSFPMSQKYSWNVFAQGLNQKSVFSEYKDFEITERAYMRNETPDEIVSTASGLAASSITTSSFTLTWNEVPATIAYHIYRNGVEIGTSAVTSYNFTGLTANTLYSIEVASEGVAGIGEKSAALSVTTLPSVPTGITITGKTATAFNVSWDDMGASQYVVYLDGSQYAQISATTYNITGLSGNTSYSVQVSAKNVTGEGAKSTATNVLTLPPAPTGVVATNITSSSFKLDWNAITGVTYYVYRDGTFLGTTTTPTYNVTGLFPSTGYSMQIAASNAAGLGNKSTAVTVTTQAPPPAAPTGVIGSSFTTSSFTLSWSAVTGATSYNVYKDGVLLGNTAVTTFGITGLTANTAYSMQVAGVNVSGEGSKSTATNIYTLPVSPSNLASSSVTENSFTLTWDAMSGVIFHVYKDGVEIGISSTPSYAVAGLTSSTTYAMKVSAANSSGEGVQSSVLNVTTSASVPGVPSGVSANSITTGSFNLTWSAVTGASTYNVYKDGALLGSTATTSYAVSALTSNTTYSMQVSAVISGVEGAKSTAISVVTIPPVPTGLAAGTFTSSGMTLTWNAMTGVIFHVYQGGVEIGISSGTSYVVSGLSANTTYTFSVSAANTSGEGAQTSTINGLTLPGIPSGLSSASITATSFTLNWTAMTGVTFKIYKDGVLAGTSATNTFNLTGLTQSTTYVMEVSAVNASGEGTKSAQLNVTTTSTLPPAPTGLAVSVNNKTKVQFTWNIEASATLYHLYMTDAGGTGAPPIHVTSSTNSVQVTGFVSLTNYSVQVSSENAAGEGPKSTAILMTTK